MKTTILMIGAFDTKGEEYAFVKNIIVSRGHDVLALHTGVFDADPNMHVDISNGEVAQAGGTPIGQLQEKRDRGEAMKVMSDGAAKIVRQLYDEERFDGAIGLGGTGGTSVITAGMQSLPLGVPKVMVSTAASGDTSVYVGTRDIAMFPSVVDVAGVNRISRVVFTRAAGAICGMVESVPEPSSDEKPIIAASMFGNTTECVDRCRETLTEKGYEVLVFHATGTGGKTMESLVDDGLVEACLDITTTEWADEICDGVFSAGPTRLDAPGKAGIPHLIVPGCIDMANYGPRDTVPAKYDDRLLYEWNPSVTLMRTNADENREMGEIFAKKINAATGPVAVLIPLKGVSILDGDGEMFCDREADQAMFDALKSGLRDDIQVEEIDCNINDDAFSTKAVDMMLDLIGKK
jgi:uncharacterized protein (UPF0261 family)